MRVSRAEERGKRRGERIFGLTENYRSSITLVVMKPALRPFRLGDLQLRILKALWARGEASVADIHAAVGSEHSLAYTTIATMLRKMEQRRLVSHREEGRAFVYRASVRTEDVNRSVARHFVDRLFEGNLAGAMAHLLQTHEVSRKELNELEKMIAQAKRRAK
jgi:BlaI family penicillinase repressor